MGAEKLHKGKASGVCQNRNGVYYKQEQVSPDEWRWAIDDEMNDRVAGLEKSRRDLYWALRSRILTDEEMARVASYGDSLVIEQMESYDPAGKQKELNDALLQQFRMRAIVAGQTRSTNSKQNADANDSQAK